MTQPYSHQEELVSIFWDYYKEVNGFRPMQIDTSKLTKSQLKQEINDLKIQRKVVFSEKREREEIAKFSIELRMKTLTEKGFINRSDALLQIHLEECTDGNDEYLCSTLGLPFFYFFNR